MENFPEKIVIASGNGGKIREIRAALAPLDAELPSLADLGAVQTPEPHGTFMENALAKARAAVAAFGCAAVADDSGLVVAALGGAPALRPWLTAWAVMKKVESSAFETSDDPSASSSAKSSLSF